jgi:hypothetical protein
VSDNDFEPDGIVVHPAPTNEEAAAIVAVLRGLKREQPSVDAPIRSAWQRAARSESMRSELAHEVDGWGRMARLGI